MAASNSIPDCDTITSIQEMSEKIVQLFISLELGKSSTEEDGVFLYACDFLTIGMIWMGFHEAIREGDGERVMVYWKFFLPLFRILKRKNFSIEAVDIQLQLHHHLSQREAAQLVWSRFINTHGRTGKNIPCDLHLEHLNRCLKTSLRNLGSNINRGSIARAAKSVGVIHHICSKFEQQTTNVGSEKHSIPSSSRDFQTMFAELDELKVFEVFHERNHSSIELKEHIFSKFDKSKYLDWVVNHIY